MTNLFYEEMIGQCENATVYNGGKCRTQQGKLRRVLSKNSGVICLARCERCMPEFFTNSKNYPVVKALKSKTPDPVFDDYVALYKRTFTIKAKKEMSKTTHHSSKD